MKVKFTKDYAYCIDGMQSTNFKKGEFVDVTDKQGKMFIDRKVASESSPEKEAKEKAAASEKAKNAAAEKLAAAEKAKEEKAKLEAEKKAKK